MKAYGTKRKDRGCCPGHDKYPPDRYNSTSADQRRRVQKAEKQEQDNKQREKFNVI